MKKNKWKKSPGLPSKPHPHQPQVWLKPPYYIPAEPFPVYIDCGFPIGNRPTAETMMKVLTQETLTPPSGFLYIDSYNGSLTPEQFIDSFIAYGQELTTYSWSKITAAGFDPALSGTYYSGLVIGRLKLIDASTLNNTMTGSVYSIWIANLQAAGRL